MQRYCVSIEKRNSFVTQLVAEIAADYYELMALDQRIDNLNRIIGLQEQSLEFARARKEGGATTSWPSHRLQQCPRNSKTFLRTA
mgnify:CR=1 FL=1